MLKTVERLEASAGSLEAKDGARPGPPLRATDVPRILIVRLRLAAESFLLGLAHEEEQAAAPADTKSAWQGILTDSKQGIKKSHSDWQSAVQNGMPHPCVAVGLLIDEAASRMTDSLRAFVSAATRIPRAHEGTSEGGDTEIRDVSLEDFVATYDRYCRKHSLTRMSVADHQDILSEFFIEIDVPKSRIRSKRHYVFHMTKEDAKKKLTECSTASVELSSSPVDHDTAKRPQELVTVDRADKADSKLTFDLERMRIDAELQQIIKEETTVQVNPRCFLSFFRSSLSSLTLSRTGENGGPTGQSNAQK